MHEVRLDSRQAPAGFSAFGKWNCSDKQGTGWTVGKHQQASVRLANGTVVTSEGRATGVL